MPRVNQELMKFLSAEVGERTADKEVAEALEEDISYWFA